MKVYNKGRRTFTILDDKGERVEVVPGRFATMDDSTALKLAKNYPLEIEAVEPEETKEPETTEAPKPRRTKKATSDNSLDL
jgi:hypothetical protein